MCFSTCAKLRIIRLTTGLRGAQIRKKMAHLFLGNVNRYKPHPYVGKPWRARAPCESSGLVSGAHDPPTRRAPGGYRRLPHDGMAINRVKPLTP